MTAPDPRTPVLIGAGQFSNRVDRGAPVLEPVDLMAESLRTAEIDTGSGRSILSQADSVRVIMLLSWRYRNPGLLVAERVGASPMESSYTPMGGNYVQTIVNRTALDILQGRNDLVLLTGAEAWRSRREAKTSDISLDWTKQGDATPMPTIVGQDSLDQDEGGEARAAASSDIDLIGPGELARGIVLPSQLYPMFDVALRAADGLSIEQHIARISQLWSDFSEVAATNPDAWIQETYTPEHLRTATPDNRMICFPYTKLMNSNNNVEQGAGVIMCSAERASALGVPRERWVFVHSGADAHDHWFVSNRANLYSSPAMRTSSRAALELASVGVDDLAHIDLYSCFPSAVQIAAHEIGLSLDRQLTVTGGMSFAGGPWNNYAMHGVATMARVLRGDPGSVGLCTANGGYLTKHAMGVYSTSPPPSGSFRWANTQTEVDATPSRDLALEWDGPVEIEAYTVSYDRDGDPERGIAATLLSDGRRAWGATDDLQTMQFMVSEELVGRRASLTNDGTLRIA